MDDGRRHPIKNGKTWQKNMKHGGSVRISMIRVNKSQRRGPYIRSFKGFSSQVFPVWGRSKNVHIRGDGADGDTGRGKGQEMSNDCCPGHLSKSDASRWRQRQNECQLRAQYTCETCNNALTARALHALLLYSFFVIFTQCRGKI